MIPFHGVLAKEVLDGFVQWLLLRTKYLEKEKTKEKKNTVFHVVGCAREELGEIAQKSIYSNGRTIGLFSAYSLCRQPPVWFVRYNGVHLSNRQCFHWPFYLLFQSSDSLLQRGNFLFGIVLFLAFELHYGSRGMAYETLIGEFFQHAGQEAL